MKDSNIRNLEMNLGVSCKNYPTEKISSYQGCIESFVYNLMKNYYKIMPFWAARKLDEVTESRFVFWALTGAQGVKMLCVNACVHL